MDKQEITFLVQDLSAYFDSVDYNLFLNRLHLEYGFGKIIQKWISSYLHNRRQQVSIGDSILSKLCTLKYGVS